MIRTVLIAAALTVLALPAQAHDDRTRAAVGAGLGAAAGAVIGSELGGRNEAILGGAIGGAVGAAIATDGRHDRHRYDGYRRARHHDGYYRHERRYERRYDHRYDRRYDRRHHYRDRGYGHAARGRGPSHCPPGLAKKGRC